MILPSQKETVQIVKSLTLICILTWGKPSLLSAIIGLILSWY